MRLLFVAVTIIFSTAVAFSQGDVLTARQYYPDVEQAVISNHGANVKLVQVSAQSGDDPFGQPLKIDAATGMATMWLYIFYSPDDYQLVVAVALFTTSSGVFVTEIHAQGWDPQMDSLAMGNNWIDSDDAASAWMQNGLQGYLDSHSGAETDRILLFSSNIIGDCWSVEVSDGIDDFDCTISAVTKEIFFCGVLNDAEDPVTAVGFSVGQVNPNPIHMGGFAQIELTLLAASSIRLSVYDVQGRLQGIVFDQRIEPGTLNLVIPSDLIPRPGVYFVRAESGADVIIRKLIVTR